MSLLVTFVTGVFKKAIVCKVDDGTELLELSRPLTCSCHLTPLEADSPEGQAIFSHSAAHVLGHAMESTYVKMWCIDILDVPAIIYSFSISLDYNQLWDQSTFNRWTAIGGRRLFLRNAHD